MWVKQRSSPEGYREDSNLHEETFGHTLEEMRGNGCTARKDNLKRKEAFFRKFIKTPSLCERPAGACIADLRKDVGLGSAAPGEFLGGVIGSFREWSKTNDCCLTGSECQHVPDARRRYNNILQSAGGSQNKGACRSDGPGRLTALNRFENEIRKVCYESEGKCGDNVQRNLIAFRDEFLNCFFLPDLSERAYQIHKGNVCKGQINEIRERFKQAANQMRAQNVTLESLSFNDLSGHVFIRECEEPRKRLEANLREQASGVLSQACNEPGQSQEESNQMAQGSQPGLFSIPTPNIRANSNSGSSRPSSGSS